MQRDKMAACRDVITLSENDRGVERQPSPVTKREEQVAEKATGVRTNLEIQDQVRGGGEPGLKGDPGEGWQRRRGAW
ncbi:hypothetical protein NDU88_006748 [Pleurodeles waltl]|uniref:Uncharacterized protein n=1 Tax=Pleurodeles waltl TaxID=8319 RepID=A0AAV7L6H7_PLEWA|nr:hypothetical protein NDU88_006748 [Pleurodeles waltl]